MSEVMMRILVIEDDISMISLIKMALNREGFQLDMASRGSEALDFLKKSDYQVIVLDLMLPDMDGYTLLRDIRSMGKNTPVLILSGLSNTDNKVEGLVSGADDYLTKPFDRRELIARIRSLMRRSNVAVVEPEKIVETGSLKIELMQKRVFVNERQVDLTAKEYAILEMLAERKGVAIAKESIMDKLYDPKSGKYPSERIIAVFICKLRKKLTDLDPKKTDYIRTAWGRGYILPELTVNA